MKELSIEEKAERYDKAIKIAKKYHNGTLKDVMETIFPELKESEDERIRRWIIDDIRYNMNNEPLNNSEYKKKAEKAIAWLEKCEQKPSNNHFTPEQADILDKHIDEFIKQNPADNVEPKFKVGDWVTNGDNTTQIVAVGTGLYIINRKDMSEVSLSTKYIEKWYHLWTIQDAQDGDVLVTDSGRPFIFKRCLDKNHPNSPVAYCGINSMNEFFVSEGINWWTDKNVYPATKEQRDTLMKAMADAGYVFDFEKKELKKIEQKSYGQRQECFDCQFNYAGECKGSCAMKRGEQKHGWSEEDDKILKSIIINIENLQFSEDMREKYHHIPNANKSYYQIKIDWLKSLKDRVQPKQEWSEEDEEVINLLLELVYEQDKISPRIPSNEKRKMMLSWLKSFKERYTWKPNDEHYELEEFAKIVRGNLTGISKAVQELFEAKYLQLTGNKMYGGFKD